MSDIRTAVITGAGSGIGLACVERLLSDGFRVIALGRRKAILEESLSKITCPTGRLIPIAADVRDRKGLYNTLSDIGPIHALAACAGVCERTYLKDNDNDAVWDNVIETNVTGVWNTFRAVQSLIVNGGSAAVVSSGLGKLGRPGYGAYAASKHAVLGMVKCFALELAAKNIRVNAVCPGWVDTEMAARDLEITARETGKTVEQARNTATAGIPLKRFVTAEEVASLISWLLSDEASAVTGQSYNISCGEFTL